MPSHYKFTYFDLRGLGEFIRWTFVQAGVQYEDHRVSMDNKDWKSDALFGQLPILEVDGVKMVQSCAIARFIARKHHLAGANPIEEAQVDCMADGFKDFMNEARDWYIVAFGFAQGDKEALFKSKVVPATQKLFAGLEKSLKSSGSGFLVGKSATWADFLIAERLDTFHGFGSHLFDGHPEIEKYVNHVKDLPKIKEWIKKRPDNKF